MNFGNKADVGTFLGKDPLKGIPCCLLFLYCLEPFWMNRYSICKTTSIGGKGLARELWWTELQLYLHQFPLKNRIERIHVGAVSIAMPPSWESFKDLGHSSNGLHAHSFSFPQTPGPGMSLPLTMCVLSDVCLLWLCTCQAGVVGAAPGIPDVAPGSS